LWTDSTSAGLNLAGGRPVYTVFGGVELELPVGGGRAEADAQRARLRLDAAEARYQERQLSVSAQVGSLRATVEAAQKQSELAARSAQVARDLAEAERQRLLLGTTTSADVVLAEQALRAAELRELRARVNSVVLHYQLEHVAGSLLGRIAPAFGSKGS
jgi:outer membrane protein TolC